MLDIDQQNLHINISNWNNKKGPAVADPFIGIELLLVYLIIATISDRGRH